MYPLLLNCYTATGEYVKPQIGGGTDENTPECFLLSGRDMSESVVKNGEFSGLGLKEVLSRLGVKFEKTGDSFPVMIKLLNTETRLPVKVYPDDEYALLHGERAGKVSLLYIADCKKDAEIVYGLSRNVSPDELQNRVQNATLAAVCNFVSVQRGDVFFIPPGVVFSIGSGISALEISTDSDAEYIISDYGRTGENGSPRPLQVNRALEVMKTRKINIRYGNVGDITLYPFGTIRELGFCELFKSELITMDGNIGFYEDENLISVILTSGEVDMSYPSGTMHLKAGNSVIIPCGVRVRLSGKAEVVYTKI